MATERKTCFVIMPFSATTPTHTEEYWTNFFEKILKPYIEEAGPLEVHRSMALRADIPRQIIQDLVTSHVVVADLTDRNPNVYWELGIRQSFRHGTVTIIEEGNKLPFDVSTKGTLFYLYSDALKMEKFKKELQQAVKDCLLNPKSPDSPVLESITGRGTLFEMFRRDETIRRMDALLSEVRFNKKTIQYNVNIEYDEEASSHSGVPQWHFALEGLRTMAIELLLVNRYLDEDDAFYSQAEQYLYLVERLIRPHGRDYHVRGPSIHGMPGQSPLDMIERFEHEISRICDKLISQV